MNLRYVTTIMITMASSNHRSSRPILGQLSLNTILRMVIIPTRTLHRTIILKRYRPNRALPTSHLPILMNVLNCVRRHNTSDHAPTIVLIPYRLIRNRMKNFSLSLPTNFQVIRSTTMISTTSAQRNGLLLQPRRVPPTRILQRILFKGKRSRFAYNTFRRHTTFNGHPSFFSTIRTSNGSRILSVPNIRKSFRNLFHIIKVIPMAMFLRLMARCTISRILSAHVYPTPITFHSSMFRYPRTSLLSSNGQPRSFVNNVINRRLHPKTISIQQRSLNQQTTFRLHRRQEGLLIIHPLRYRNVRHQQMVNLRPYPTVNYGNMYHNVKTIRQVFPNRLCLIPSFLHLVIQTSIPSNSNGRVHLRHNRRINFLLSCNLTRRINLPRIRSPRHVNSKRRLLLMSRSSRDILHHFVATMIVSQNRLTAPRASVVVNNTSIRHNKTMRNVSNSRILSALQLCVLSGPNGTQ